MKNALSPKAEARILQLLLEGRTMGQVAQMTAQTRTRVESVAAQYEWPDQDRVRDAVAALLDDEDTPTEPAAAHGVTSGRELVAVPVSELHADPDNPREGLSGIEELAESIEANGLLQPIIARRRGGRLIVVAGHRRLAAVQLLRWGRVEVVVTRDMAPDHVLQAMLVENGQRAGLDPIEEARALARLKAQTGETGVALGRRIGRSQGHVDGRLALLALSPSDQDLVRAGQLPIQQAVDKARIEAGTAGAERPSWHLGVSHSLASKARGRCRKVHGRARLVGGVACGECWETVIRADERTTLHTHSAATGRCSLCQSPVADEPLVDDVDDAVAVGQ